MLLNNMFAPRFCSYMKICLLTINRNGPKSLDLISNSSMAFDELHNNYDLALPDCLIAKTACFIYLHQDRSASRHRDRLFVCFCLFSIYFEWACQDC